jgi:gluconolactonase
MAVEADGTVCVATIMNGGISRINPETGDIRHVATGDPMTTNICFGGGELKTAYITASGTGKLLATEWNTRGLPLNFLNK